jgi:hypothetical protein
MIILDLKFKAKQSQIKELHRLETTLKKPRVDTNESENEILKRHET